MHNHNHLGVHLKAAHEYVPPYNTPRRILCTDTFCLNVTVARFRNFRPNTHQQRQKCARRVIWPQNPLRVQRNEIEHAFEEVLVFLFGRCGQ